MANNIRQPDPTIEEIYARAKHLRVKSLRRHNRASVGQSYHKRSRLTERQIKIVWDLHFEHGRGVHYIRSQTGLSLKSIDLALAGILVDERCPQCRHRVLRMTPYGHCVGCFMKERIRRDNNGDQRKTWRNMVS